METRWERTMRFEATRESGQCTDLKRVQPSRMARESAKRGERLEHQQGKARSTSRRYNQWVLVCSNSDKYEVERLPVTKASVKEERQTEKRIEPKDK